MGSTSHRNNSRSRVLDSEVYRVVHCEVHTLGKTIESQQTQGLDCKTILPQSDSLRRILKSRDDELQHMNYSRLGIITQTKTQI